MQFGLFVIRTLSRSELDHLLQEQVRLLASATRWKKAQTFKRNISGSLKFLLYRFYISQLYPCDFVPIFHSSVFKNTLLFLTLLQILLNCVPQSAFYNIKNIRLTQIIFKFNNKVDFYVHKNSLGSVSGNVYFWIPRNNPLFVSLNIPAVFSTADKKQTRLTIDTSLRLTRLLLWNVEMCLCFFFLSCITSPLPNQTHSGAEGRVWTTHIQMFSKLSKFYWKQFSWNKICFHFSSCLSF